MERSGAATGGTGKNRETPPAPSSEISRSWTGLSLTDAMRRAQFVGLVLISLLLGGAALLSEIAVPHSSVLIVTAAVLTAGSFTLLLRASPLVLIASHYLAVAFYHVIALNPDDPLVGLLIPLTSWTIVLPIMLWQGRWPLICSVLLALIFGAIIGVVHPGWDRDVLTASVTANAIMVTLAFLFMYYLRRLAVAVDRHSYAAAQERLRAIRTRTLSEATAEYLRVLHDTIINTFGALGRRWPLGISVAEARDRCRHDLERVQEFQREPPGSVRKASLVDLASVGLPVRWTGLAGENLRRYEALLPADTLRALHGCATEAIINATKHSGADHVTCDVRHLEDELRVEIADDGRGFDRSHVTERGIAGSIIARAEANGIDVTLRSSPGKGTAVRLRCPLARHEPAPQSSIASEAVTLIRDFELQLAVGWAVHAIFIGILLLIFNRQGGADPASLLFAMLILLMSVAAIRCRTVRQAPNWLVMVMLAAIPLANWCALTAVDYGRDAPYLFPSVALTVLPVLIYVTTTTQRPFVAALALHLLSTLALASIDPDGEGFAHIGMVLFLQVPAFGLVLVVVVFLRNFRSLGVQLAEERHEIERTMIESAAREAVTEVQKQWSVTALQRPIQLLQEIADGTISPADPETRKRCAEEESYLRQISALPTEATLMSWWFALALAEARVRQVALHLQAEQAHIKDPRHADALGTLMLDCINRATRNSELRISIVEQAGEPHMFIVGNDASGLAKHVHTRNTAPLTLRCEELPGHILIEATVDDPPFVPQKRASGRP